MSSVLTIQIKQTAAAANSISSDYVAPGNDPKDGAAKLVNYLNALAGGSDSGQVVLLLEDDNGVTSSNTVTCSRSSVSNGDIVSIGGVDLTAVSASPGTDEFLVGANDTELATNLAGAINAQVELSKYLLAVPAAGVVTVTSKSPGTAANLITFTATVTSGTPFVFGSPTMTGATGTEVTSQVYSFGL